MTNKVRREDVQKWVELLRSSVATERLKGAQELASLGVRTRGAVRTRGTISKPAPSRVPKGVDFSAVMEAFKDQHFEVRREVAFVLGEWADETAVKVLSEITRTDAEPVVRHEAVRALGKIGGPAAVRC
jgi:HEAT repeat protein